MAESNDNCHFDLTIEIQPAVQGSTGRIAQRMFFTRWVYSNGVTYPVLNSGPAFSPDIMFLLPRLIACAK